MDTLNIPSKGGGGRREDWWAPYLFVGWILYSDILNVHDLYMEKVCFWPFNYHPSSILAIKLQNRVFLTIKLSKPFIFGHLAVLKGSFTDVDDTWRWGPHVSFFFSPLSSLSPFLCSGALGRRQLFFSGRRQADIWAPLPRVVHINKTILQNSQMIKYKQFW